MKIREGVETKPIEVNVQSVGILPEEKIFYTTDNAETEEQIGEGKKQLPQN